MLETDSDDAKPGEPVPPGAEMYCGGHRCSVRHDVKAAYSQHDSTREDAI